MRMIKSWDQTYYLIKSYVQNVDDPNQRVTMKVAKLSLSNAPIILRERVIRHNFFLAEVRETLITH